MEVLYKSYLGTFIMMLSNETVCRIKGSAALSIAAFVSNAIIAIAMSGALIATRRNVMRAACEALAFIGSCLAGSLACHMGWYSATVLPVCLGLLSYAYFVREE
jgi:hypothetical protein